VPPPNNPKKETDIGSFLDLLHRNQAPITVFFFINVSVIAPLSYLATEPSDATA